MYNCVLFDLVSILFFISIRKIDLAPIMLTYPFSQESGPHYEYRYHAYKKSVPLPTLLPLTVCAPMGIDRVISSRWSESCVYVLYYKIVFIFVASLLFSVCNYLLNIKTKQKKNTFNRKELIFLARL